MTKSALITGGAGGIALELGKRLVQRGYSLILVDLDAEKLAAHAGLMGGTVTTIRADLTQKSDLDLVADRIQSEPNLELLVNNAGIVRPGSIVDLPYEILERHTAVNLLAPMRLTQAAARAMIPRGTGCILSIVSAAGIVALPGSAAYSASKFGLRGYLTSASEELAPRGIKIRNIFPGAVDTPMLRYEAANGGSPLNFLNKDVLRPEDVAAACIRALDGTSLEYYLPFWDGVSSRVISIFPGLIPRLLPWFEKQGRAGLARYVASRGLRVEGKL
jgi:2-dehydro-3-deoxy-L-rhamnonate dehydrogenase (NAD+)